MGKTTFISDDILNTIKSLYVNGHNLSEISKELKISRYIVTTKLKDLGLYEQIKTKRHDVKKKDLSNNDIKEIISLWNDNYSTEYISNIYKCNRSTIRDILIENGIDTKRKSYNLKKYNHDELFFKNIDSEEKAYWLGFIVADGHISDSALITNLHIYDKNHLEKMKNDLNTEAPVLIYDKHENRNGFKEDFQICSLNICSSSICKDLKTYGIDNRKSWDIDVDKLTSKIPDNLIRHFIRGIFDGDGCIGIYDQAHGSGNLYNFSIVGLKDLMTFIKDKLNINTKLRYDSRTKSTYILKCGKKDDILRIKEYLYKDANVYMQRKYDKFNEII